MNIHSDRPLFIIRVSLLPLVSLLFFWLGASASGTPAFGTPVVAMQEEGPMHPDAIDTFIGPLFDDDPAPPSRYTVDVHVLRIRSRYADDTPTEVRVQVFIPEAASYDIRGVYLFAPGSTGLIGPCRASREHEAGIRWGLYRAHVLAFAGQGMVGILPDYIGFEDSLHVQPYFHAESEARVIFDAFQAVDQWVSHRYPRRFPEGLFPYTRVASGFSQGGHASFAAADYNRTLGRSLPLHGVIGYGPTTDLQPLLLTFPSLAPMIVHAFSAIYGSDRFDPDRILQSRWAETLAYDTTRQCVGGMQRYYPSDPEQLFTPSFLDALHERTLSQTHPQIEAIFRENSTGLSAHGVPALILQGTDDIVVDIHVQNEFVAALRRRENPVTYRVYENTRHDTRQRAFFDVLEWIESFRSQ